MSCLLCLPLGIVVALLSCAELCAADEPAFSVAAVLVDKTALAGAHDVELQGKLAFVAGKGGALAIIDVAEPTRPRIIWSQQDAKAFEDAETVLPAGDYLFLGTRDFLALDIRDPRRPVVTQTLADRLRIDRINGLVRHQHLVLAANKSGWIDAFDVSTPDKPKLFGALDVRTRDKMSSPHDIDLRGDLLVLVDAAGFGRSAAPGQLGIYRLVDKASGKVLPLERWTLVGRLADPRLAGANRVRVAGPYAYVGCSISPQAVDRASRQANVAVIDLSSPDKPMLVATVPFPDTRGPNGLTVAGRVVFAAGGQTILAIDISDPRRPAVLEAYKCTEVFRDSAGEDDAHDLVYRDGYLYVTGQTTHSFGILRIDRPKIRGLADKRP